MQKLLLIFKALSEETRLRILRLLEKEELCVCDITESLNMTQPNISFHLGMLKEAGIIKDRKEGRWMHYSLDESDIFIRFLLLGVLEKFKDKLAEKDKERLMGLLSAKEGDRIVSISRGIRRGKKC